MMPAVICAAIIRGKPGMSSAVIPAVPNNPAAAQPSVERRRKARASTGLTLVFSSHMSIA
jgi:hypothetical protein